MHLKSLMDKAVPALACVALLQAELQTLFSFVDETAPAGAERSIMEAPSAEQRRLQDFVETLYAEGAIDNLEPCRGSDACLSVTAMFAAFSDDDKAAIGRLIQRYFETRPARATPIRSVRFMEAHTGREIGQYRDRRLAWKSRHNLLHLRSSTG